MTRSYCKQPGNCTAGKYGACLRCVDKMFERDDEIVRLFVEDKTTSVTSLSKQFGVDKAQISRILKKRGVEDHSRMGLSMAAAARARHAAKRGFPIPAALTEQPDRQLFVALAKKFDPSRAEQIMLGSQQ